MKLAPQSDEIRATYSAFSRLQHSSKATMLVSQSVGREGAMRDDGILARPLGPRELSLLTRRRRLVPCGQHVYSYHAHHPHIPNAPYCTHQASIRNTSCTLFFQHPPPSSTTASWKSEHGVVWPTHQYPREAPSNMEPDQIVEPAPTPDGGGLRTMHKT
jgi:hypothetical protein